MDERTHNVDDIQQLTAAHHDRRRQQERQKQPKPQQLASLKHALRPDQI